MARATDAQGLFYLDTGEPTPLYWARTQALRGQGSEGAKSAEAAQFTPEGGARNKDDQYEYDAERGLYYTNTKNGRRYITNDPAAQQAYAETPMYTVEALPDPGGGGYRQTLQNAAGLAALGSTFGPAGTVAGGTIGALSGLPSARGTQLRLNAGDASQAMPGQRIGTQAEADAAMQAYAATGDSSNYTPSNFPGVVNGSGTGGYRVPTYTPTMGTNGGSALSAEAQRVLSQASGFAAQNQQAASQYGAQAATAGQRAAPQYAAPSSAQQTAVYDRAMNFNAQSGAAAIRAERADVSGANRLENYQLDQQGINNLEAFRSTNSEQGVNALYGYNPDATYQSARELNAFQATNTQEGANAVYAFNPDMVQQDAQSLRNFQSDRSGIDRLNAYADEAQGPSQAQAMLRAQADADKRAALATARSGRGTPASNVQMQRQAITEGAMIAAETRGQGAALAAQEHDTYKARQLQALAQAGSLISAAEAQRLTALSNAGALMSQADQQKLQALTVYGQLKSQMDSLQLSAKQSAGQLNASGDTNRLGAISNAASLQGQMDQQRLSAINAAAGYRTQGDQIQSNNLQSAAQIRLAGSEINQRGAIAASNADLQAQALNLQSLSLAGNISTAIREQDIGVLRDNLNATMNTMNMNDQQVRFFSQLESDRNVASQNMQQQANALGINAQQAQAALDLQWQQFQAQQFNQQQNLQYNYDALAQSGAQNQQQLNMQQQSQQYNQRRQETQDNYQLIGSALTAFSNLFPSTPAAPPPGNASRIAQGTAPLPTNMAGQYVPPPQTNPYQVFPAPARQPRA
jgi:hypothetical protein